LLKERWLRHSIRCGPARHDPEKEAGSRTKIMPEHKDKRRV
jgi:hypothetical protein